LRRSVNKRVCEESVRWESALMDMRGKSWDHWWEDNARSEREREVRLGEQLMVEMVQGKKGGLTSREEYSRVREWRVVSGGKEEEDLPECIWVSRSSEHRAGVREDGTDSM
jgi:hypothetical protein